MGFRAGVVFEIPRRLDLQEGEFRLHASEKVGWLIGARSSSVGYVGPKLAFDLVRGSYMAGPALWIED
jgi:hypothetical protein